MIKFSVSPVTGGLTIVGFGVGVGVGVVFMVALGVPKVWGKIAVPAPAALTEKFLAIVFVVPVLSR